MFMHGSGVPNDISINFSEVCVGQREFETDLKQNLGLCHIGIKTVSM